MRASAEEHAGPSGPGLAGPLRAVLRGVGIMLFTAGCIPVQAVLLAVPGSGVLGRGKVVFARFYWATLCRFMGMRVRMLGTPARLGLGSPGRPVVFAANHSSWLDVLVVGGSLEGCFVAKEEVGRWPVIRTVARLGRTVFVSRRAQDTGRERDAMRARLSAGDNLVLFPEGTSNDGSRVLKFRSAFFSICHGDASGDGPLIQPVSVVYDQLGGLPLGRSSRVQAAWFGDMDLASHFWKLAQQRGRLRATVLMHPPLDPADFPTRKALADAVWVTVAEGAAMLRQNRAPEPGG
ncbi:MAG: lysophospholipid acyltransferase family protein [Janthinobacterium lividum]